MPSSSRILCLGIGNMGAALAGTLLSADNSHKISIWNRTSDRPQVKSLVQSGAHLELNPGEAITNNDVIIICVLDYPSMFSILTPIASTLKGKVVVNLTNGTPRQSTESQKWMRECGVGQYFDGAVMVTPQLIGTPHSFLIYSGETEKAFQSSALDLVSPLGLSLYVGEDVASAATNDLAALATMYGMFSGAFIGMGLLKKHLLKSGDAGVKVAVTPAVKQVVVPLLQALIPYVTLIAETVDEEDWDDDKGNPLGMQHTGVLNILQACKEEGVNGGGLEPLAALMKRVIDNRGGDGGVAEVARFIVE